METVARLAGRVVKQGRAGALRLADYAGTVTRSLPGAAGALMLAYGLGQVYRPLFWIALGLFALAIDRRIP